MWLDSEGVLEGGDSDAIKNGMFEDGLTARVCSLTVLALAYLRW